MNLNTLARRSLISLAFLGWLTVASSMAARASEEADAAPVAQFAGHWQGEGTLFGADAKFDMRWESVLGGQFMRLVFANRMVGPDGEQPVLQAEALYRPLVDQLWEGTWFDSRGMVLPLRATATATELISYWGSAETERGRTVYRSLPDGGLEVEDWVFSNGQWRQFGHARYRRLDETRD